MQQECLCIAATCVMLTPGVVDINLFICFYVYIFLFFPSFHLSLLIKENSIFPFQLGAGHIPDGIPRNCAELCDTIPHNCAIQFRTIPPNSTQFRPIMHNSAQFYTIVSYRPPKLNIIFRGLCDHILNCKHPGGKHTVTYRMPDLVPNRPLNLVYQVKCDHCLAPPPVLPPVPPVLLPVPPAVEIPPFHLDNWLAQLDHARIQMSLVLGRHAWQLRMLLILMLTYN
ncbi:hypothetical protein PVAND_009152 [Polypedilum vanderplanki]|uniref:Uncharacterized protein n=1 Tax=Polypedilum vanderplanki TaxID=319348 RepID=A0A9J6CCM4_POLVA|nr:hypothetical protein PVAND_009152 [Polypedilum vanderplanki]